MTIPRLLRSLPIALALMTGVDTAHAASTDTVASTRYDLDDVLFPPHDFPTSWQATSPSDPAPAEHPITDRERMDAFLRRTFEPGMADLILAHSTIQATSLTVTGSPALRDHITETLAHLRADRDRQIHTSLRVALMDPRHRQDQYALKDLDWKPLPGSPGLAFAALTPAQHDTLEARWNTDAGVTGPVSPSLTCYSDQLANATFKTMYAYPKLEFNAAGPAVGSGILCFGNSLQVRAIVTDDHRFIHLAMSYDSSSLLSVPSVTIGTKADGTPLTVEEPQVWSSHEQIDQVMENGSSLILATGLVLEKDQPPRAGFLLVTCESFVPRTSVPGTPTTRMKPVLQDGPPVAPGAGARAGSQHTF